MPRSTKQKNIIFLALLASLTIFGFSAREAWASIFGLDSIAGEAVGSVILYMSNVVMSFLGHTLSQIANLLGSFLNLQGSYFEDIAIVKNSWEVFRNFSNMFFILILIIIAFATIFDMGRYNWRGLMAKFILAALLINFSLAIGGFIIKISTTLSNVMLNQFSDITLNLAGGFGLNKLIDAKGASASSGDVLIGVVMTQIISSVGMIILTAIVLLAFVSAFAFSVARIPILWALLIVSPVVCISSILPQTKKIWDQWWSWFLCWTFFMPAYLFSLVMGLGILANRSDIETAIDLSKASGLAQAGNFFGLGIQSVFFYILTVIIMLGGLAGSIKIACAAGGGAVKTFGAISGTVNKWAKDKTGYTAAKKGLLEKAGEIKDTGFKGRIGGMLYGGERAERLREAKVAEYLGKKGALSEAEAGEVQKSYARWKLQSLSQNLGKDDLDKLNTQAVAGKFNNFEKLALRKLRAENGWVASGPAGVQEIENTIREAGENGKFAQEYIDALKKNGFSEALGSIKEAEDLAGNTTILPLKKAILETMAKNGQLVREDLFDKTLDIFKTDSRAVQESIEKELQKNIKNIKRTKSERAAFLMDATKRKDARRLFASQMSEDGEIVKYEQYKTAVDLFGGENEAPSRQMLSKVMKDDPATHAEIEFRQEVGRTNSRAIEPSYLPTPIEMAVFKSKLAEKFKRMDAGKIAEVDKDKWALPQFKDALQQRIDDLEVLERTIPAIPAGLGRRGVREKPGAGKRLYTNLKKAVGTDPNKLPVVNGLRVP